MFEYFNPNPSNQRVGDCVVRALCKILGKDWENVYVGLCADGLIHNDMPSANYVWGSYLQKYGFKPFIIPSVCPECTTVEEFAKDHPEGRFVLVCQNHVVAVVSGTVFDTWDSSNEVVYYYYARKD